MAEIQLKGVKYEKLFYDYSFRIVKNLTNKNRFRIHCQEILLLQISFFFNITFSKEINNKYKKNI